MAHCTWYPDFSIKLLQICSLKDGLCKLNMTKILLDGVEVKVNYQVRNCMNDGKASRVQKALF